MIRKINVICLAFLLTIIGAFDAYASDNYDAVLPQSGSKVVLDVPLHKQDKNSNKCGPTCCRMTLEYFGVSKSLDTIVNEMKTYPDHDYTHIDSSRYMLNDYISGNHYVKKTNLSSLSEFIRILRQSIDAGYPMHCLLETQYLPAYSNAKFSHYVVATGYMWGQGGSTGGGDFVFYNDPHYNNTYYGRHSCSANDMYRAIVAHSACFLWGN